MKKELDEKTIFKHFLKYLECNAAHQLILDTIDKLKENNEIINKQLFKIYLTKTISTELEKQTEIDQFKMKEIKTPTFFFTANHFFCENVVLPAKLRHVLRPYRIVLFRRRHDGFHGNLVKSQIRKMQDVL